MHDGDVKPLQTPQCGEGEPRADQVGATELSLSPHGGCVDSFGAADVRREGAAFAVSAVIALDCGPVVRPGLCDGRVNLVDEMQLNLAFAFLPEIRESQATFVTGIRG